MTQAQLAAMSHDQLTGMLNVAELHIREKGPIAFGGYFMVSPVSMASTYFQE